MDKAPDSKSQALENRSFIEKKLGLETNPVVFWWSAGLIAFFLTVTLLNHERVEDIFSAIQQFVAEKAGWFYIISVNIILVFMIYLLFSRYRNIRIGGENAKPEFSNLAWFSMLFNAGIGLALMFYSVAEPILHFSNPPFGPAETRASAQLGMDLTFLHWGFHGWAIYALVGLSVAFFAYNVGLPLSIRSVFYPVIGKRIYKTPGNVIDILAVVATLFGLATTLGLGIKHINAGLFYLFGLPENVWLQVVLIGFITICATVSVVLGLQSGIRRLSILSTYIAFLLMFFMLIAGPTLFILDSFVQNVGHYIQKLPELGTWAEVYKTTNWQNGWTIFYWGWWFAWAPFVGIFIARISRGRTIKEFIIGVLGAPSLAIFIWLTIFGGTALHEELFGGGGITEAVNANVSTAMYVLLERFPFPFLSSLFVLFAAVIFFVTSSDSGSLVVDFITTGGNHHPPVRQRIFWALLEGLVASVLLIGGGLIALQTGSLVTGLPIAFVLLMVCYSLPKGLKKELTKKHEHRTAEVKEVMTPPK